MIWTNKNKKDYTYFKTNGVLIVAPSGLECKNERKKHNY